MVVLVNIFGVCGLFALSCTLDVEGSLSPSKSCALGGVA